MMPADAEYCTECGAPLTDAPGVVGSDAEVYPELAKANVFRMRKEFKAAEDICLAILRRFPNNASSNTLLGDIAVEKGELDQAVEWYELALDIVPDSAENQQKLANVRAKLAEQQTQTAVETLGIPEKKPPYMLIALAGVIVGVFIIAGVMMINRNNATGENPNNPVDLSAREDRGVQPAAPTPNNSAPVEEQTYEANEAMAARLCRELQIDAARVPTLEIGSRDKDIRLTLNITQPDGEWPLRAKAVRKAFELAPDAPRVELTATDGDRTMNLTVTLETYKKTLDPSFDPLNEVLLVETLLGHRMEAPATPDPNATPPANNGTVTPPMGDDGTSNRAGSSTADDSGTSGTGTGTGTGGGETGTTGGGANPGS